MKMKPIQSDSESRKLIDAIPYGLVYLNREGLNITEIPIAGFTHSLLSRYPFYPVSESRKPYRDTEQMARLMADNLNIALKARGMPGKVFAVLARDLTKQESAAIAAL